ncbi:flagellar motor protein MotB [Pelagicoccus sp. SDUM812003]|uniref:OmpA/MotB family protein n=1 Tax=Pelagicoccus sp. SDUM812003 TaxID=3041267 RepID=UPI00280E87A8|nr:flagellar motor protein MotB [Pelagicoccus sp. SDUM812003]MDQ8202552.1 flagellar motor protein MotB [Pelagicoccus sp. SDUM812003]
MKQLGTHHGGAWKVAYADFVTAMMALFMVLWLTSQDESLKRDLAKYFQDPYNTPMDNSMGVLNNKANDGGVKKEQAGQAKGKAEISDFKVLYEMAQEFMRLLNIDSVNPDQKPVDLDVTSDGLRVTLYDRDAHPFFVENTADYTPWGSFVIETLAWLVQRHNFMVRVDGYVSEGFQGDGWEYTAWELSSDRANSTRRLLERYGVRAGQFKSVTAHGTREPLPFMHPTAEANDRVSISLVLSEVFNILDARQKEAEEFGR